MTTMTSVEILCENCKQGVSINEETPRIKKGLYGNYIYTRVTALCPHCGKITTVPQNEETEELLNKRISSVKPDFRYLRLLSEFFI